MGLTFLVIWLAILAATCYIASEKHRSVVGWFFLAFFFTPFALIIVAALPAAQARVLPGPTGQDKLEALRSAVARAGRLEDRCNSIIQDIERSFVDLPADGVGGGARHTYLRALRDREEAVHRLERATDTSLMRADPERALSDALAAEDQMQAALSALRDLERHLFPNRPPLQLYDDTDA